jgi:spermidine/putrescine transport system substrate-binding protein
VVVALRACVLVALVAALGAEDVSVLRILNWSTYIDTDPEVAEDRPMAERSPTLRTFAEREGCRIEYVEYDTENEALHKILSLPAQFDVVVMAEYMALSLREQDRLLPIASGSLGNFRHLDQRYLGQPLADGRYDHLPYLAGTTGLVYRRDLLAAPLHSWQQVFNPDPQLHGHLCLPDEPGLLFCMVMMMNGQDHLRPEEAELRGATETVARLLRSGAVPFIESDPDRVFELLSGGSALAAVVYSGDAWRMQRELGAERLAYVIPDEGGEFYIDHLAILRDAPHPELARRFIDFVLEPQVQAGLARELGFICPNATGQAWLRGRHPGHFASPIVDPPPEVLGRTRLLPTVGWDARVRGIWQALREEAPR